ncbi:MAG: helix-turn-helix transcriptional regulator [Deltaproteobacteria bacterium]|nr:helix-turn-helix transcriptional regulator [Deltaproteobacteria bacterium]
MQTNKRRRRRRRRPRPACCEDLGRLLSPRLFKALGDPSRVGLLTRLAWAGRPRTVSEVADGTERDISVVSRHLAILRDAGIIECTRHGKEVRCSVRAGALAGLLRDLADTLEACCPADGAAAAACDRGRKRGTHEPK